MEALVTQNDGALRVNIVKLKKETGLKIEAVRGVGYKIL
jgi:biotin operon repressor